MPANHSLHLTRPAARCDTSTKRFLAKFGIQKSFSGKQGAALEEHGPAGRSFRKSTPPVMAKKRLVLAGWSDGPTTQVNSRTLASAAFFRTWLMEKRPKGFAIGMITMAFLLAIAMVLLGTAIIEFETARGAMRYWGIVFILLFSTLVVAYLDIRALRRDRQYRFMWSPIRPASMCSRVNA